MNCVYCDEPVAGGEQHDHFPGQPMHIECGFRSLVGSVAHLLRRCSCFQLGSTMGDPPGMTKREAAKAALTLFQQMAGWFGTSTLYEKRR